MIKKSIFKGVSAKRVILFSATLVLSVLLMAAIYFSSCQSAEESAVHSSAVSDNIVKIIDSEHEKPEAYNAKDLYYKVEAVTRKVAHFFVFALLGVLTYIAAGCLLDFSKSRIKPAFLSVPTGIIYSICDELHQTTVQGRHGKATDVVIDAAGVLVGTLIAMSAVSLFYRYIKKRRAKQEVKE